MYLSSFIQPQYISVLGTTLSINAYDKNLHTSHNSPCLRIGQLNMTQQHLPNILLYEECRQILVIKVQDNARIPSPVQRGALVEIHIKVAGEVKK